MKPVVSVRTFDHLDTELTEAAKTFGAGLSEDVVCELSRYRWISLVTDGTTRGYQVDGSVRLSNSRYRIVLRLATAPNGHLLWCETFDCETSNMLNAQRTLAQSAVSRIMAQIEQNEQQTRPPVAAEQTAYWLWQQGKAQLFQFTSASNAQAKRSLLHAIKLDPEFVPAYVAMSNADQMDAFFNYSGARHECLMSGMSMAKTAIDIDASDALAHLALGKVLIRTMDVDEAAVELEIARNLCPSLAEAHYASGVALYYAGQPKRALPYVERSIELDPLGPRMWCMRHLMARCLFDLGKFDGALHWARQAVNSPNSKSIALALKAAAARKAGYKGLAIQTVGDLRKKDPRMTSQYLVENLGNERIRDRVDDLAETLSKCGLPE
jgi:TolB-like protein